jgi:fatty acid-binding protein DegV
MEQLAILHTAAEEEARQLRQRLSNLFPGDATPEIVEVTPAIGAHIGPKAVGLACILAAS